jgi:hypothetical protein
MPRAFERITCIICVSLCLLISWFSHKIAPYSSLMYMPITYLWETKSAIHGAYMRLQFIGCNQGNRKGKLGDDLRSQDVAIQVPSALAGLTAGFEKGPGVPPPLKTPRNSPCLQSTKLVSCLASAVVSESKCNGWWLFRKAVFSQLCSRQRT